MEERKHEIAVHRYEVVGVALKIDYGVTGVEEGMDLA